MARLFATRDNDRRAEQVLVRISAVLGTVLSSVPIPSDTNGSKTAMAMVRSLVRKGRLIVGDAAYCQRDICEETVDSCGDYLVTLKGNQPQRLRDIELASVNPQSFSPLRNLAGRGTSPDSRHQREESRSHRHSDRDDHDQLH